MSIVTLSGDRQAGKTHAALSAAVTSAICGNKTAYIGVDLDYAKWVREMVELMVPELITRVVRAAGENSIDFLSGGRLIFRSHRQIATLRGAFFDTCVLDDWPDGQYIPIDLQTGASHLYVCLMADE